MGNFERVRKFNSRYYAHFEIFQNVSWIKIELDNIETLKWVNIIKTITVLGPLPRYPTLFIAVPT